MNPIYNAGIRIGMCSLVLACAACDQNMSEPIADESTAMQEQNQSTTELVAPPKAITSPSWIRQIAEAKEDLSSRTGVTSENITIRSARAVTWGSSALGCPKPDVSYTEGLEDGLQLLLEAEGIVYIYHGKKGADLFYCPKELAKAPAYGPGEEIM